MKESKSDRKLRENERGKGKECRRNTRVKSFFRQKCLKCTRSTEFFFSMTWVFGSQFSLDFYILVTESEYNIANSEQDEKYREAIEILELSIFPVKIYSIILVLQDLSPIWLLVLSFLPVFPWIFRHLECSPIRLFIVHLRPKIEEEKRSQLRKNKRYDEMRWRQLNCRIRDAGIHWST